MKNNTEKEKLILGGEIRNAKDMPTVFYARHIEPGIVRYEEKELDLYIDNSTLNKMNKSFAGKPVFVGHQKVDLDTLQNDLDGVVSESFYNPLDGWHWLRFVAISDNAKEKIAQGWSISNSYYPTQLTNGGEYHGIPYDNKISDGEYYHLAIVDNPRYENSIIMTEDEYKEYNEKKKIELANSKEKRKGVISMNLWRNKREKVKELSDITGVTVELENGKEILITDLVEAVEKQKTAEEKKAEKTEIMNAKVKVGGSEMTVTDLANSYLEILKNAEEETEEEKKKREEKEKMDAAEAEKKNDADKQAADEKDKLKKDEMENSKRLADLKKKMENSKGLKPKPFTSLKAGLERGKDRY